jgi:hypothetical protein
MSAATASPASSLTVAPHFVPPPVEALPRPMCCVALAYRVTDGQAWRLGTAEPGSVWGAVLWLSLRAAQLADQLDPPAARALRAWLDSDAEAERATVMLLAGQPYFLLVPDAGVHYVLSAAPDEGAGGPA